VEFLICLLKDGNRVLPSDFPIRYTCCILGVNEAWKLLFGSMEDRLPVWWGSHRYLSKTRL
jgi:hypothetical protein